MKTLRSLALAALAAAFLPAAAQAQYASAQPAPLYPYAVQPGQPYAVEVAPGTYVIKRPAERRGYPYVRCVTGCDGSAATTPRNPSPRSERRVTHNDPALIEELRRRHGGKVKHEVVNTTRIVRDKPVVIEHERVVDDPPRVIERRHYVEDAPPAKPHRRTAKVEADVMAPAEKKAGKRVIRAEAEVTILGPDRMSIRLFRKGKAGAAAKAEAE
ncbi:MAG TPA: hypothetical protein VN655_17045 [Pseudolabrys sp.]|nr:hypothetical protein [Pseudolabrys sp.]